MDDADRRLLTDLFDAAVAAADPARAIARAMPAPPKGRTVVVGLSLIHISEPTRPY